MSTYAAVFIKNENTGLFSGFDVKYDGYIEGGVGEILFEDYSDINKISELCYDSRSEMRQLDAEIEKCEWFEDELPNRAKKYKNLTFDQMISQGKQCNYCYIYYPIDNEYIWMVLDKNGAYGTFKPLEQYFTPTSPEKEQDIVLTEANDTKPTADTANYKFVIESETYTDNYENGEGKYVGGSTWDSVINNAKSLEDALSKFWSSVSIGNTYDFNADKSGIVLDRDNNKLMYNRTENEHNEIPSETELEQWKAGKIDLYATYYYVKIFKEVLVPASELESLGIDTDN